MNVKINDIVRFLNDVGGGRVTRIEGKTVYVEDEDGFERPAFEKELVVVDKRGPRPRPMSVRWRSALALWSPTSLLLSLNLPLNRCCPLRRRRKARCLT